MDSNAVITNTPNLTPVSTMESPKSAPTSWNMGSILRYGAIFLIIAFLGFNVFTYLGKATDKTSGVVGGVFKKITSLLGGTIKQTAQMSAKGTKLGVDVAEGTVESGVNVLEGTLTGKKQRNKIDDTTPALDPSKDKPKKTEDGPLPDEAGSRTQSSKTGKSGFCYIGEDRGFRSCVAVNEGDTCMSGDIFPTKDLCINPNLRQ